MKKILFLVIALAWVELLIAQDKTIFFPDGAWRAKGKTIANRREGKWEFFNEKGEKLLEINYQKGLAHGKVIRYNENNQKIAEAYFQKDELNGTCIWYENNKKRIEGAYEAQEMTGKWSFFDEHEQLVKETDYLGGLPHGTEKIYLHGHLFQKATYLAGELEGYFVQFFPHSSQIAVQGKYEDGKKTGEWIYFRADGKKIQIVNYQDGLKHGTLTYFANEAPQRIEEWKEGKLWNILLQRDKSGKEQPIGHFKNGNGTVRIYTNNNSQEYKELVYENGTFTGITHYFNLNGKLIKTTKQHPNTPLLEVTEFAENQKIIAIGWCDTNWVADSTWQYFHQNGKIAEKGNYKRGQRNDYWEFYSEKGKIITSGNYQNGQKKGEWKTYSKKGITTQIF